MDLRYIRDVHKREVDFVVLKDGKPLFAVECKSGAKQVSPHIKYFQKRTAIPKFYQVHMGQQEYIQHDVSVLNFQTFCKKTAMP